MYVRTSFGNRFFFTDSLEPVVPAELARSVVVGEKLPLSPGYSISEGRLAFRRNETKPGGTVRARGGR